MANQQKLPLQQVQKDPAELERCRKDPLYFYNKYIRIEGEKVLTQAEYEAHVAAVKRFNDATRPPILIDLDAAALAGVSAEEMFRLIAEQGTVYQSMPDETYPATLKDFEDARPKIDPSMKDKIKYYGTAGDIGTGEGEQEV